MNNDTALGLRVLAWVLLVIGVIWAIFTWIVITQELMTPLLILAGAGFCFGVLLGISEIVKLLAEQTEASLRIAENLKKLVPAEEPSTELKLCVRCGTQLPPGGKTCPTCHHVNE